MSIESVPSEPIPEQQPIPEITPQEQPIDTEPAPQEQEVKSFSPDIKLGQGNCFEILNLPEDADEGQIKERFRELTKAYHPDKGGNQADFIKLHEAYDEAKKAAENGGDDGVAPEAIMVAAAGVSASGMPKFSNNPEARRSAEDAVVTARTIAEKERNLSEAQKAQTFADIERQKEFERRANQEHEEVQEFMRKTAIENEAKQRKRDEINRRDYEKLRAEFTRDAFMGVIFPSQELMSQSEIDQMASFGRILQAADKE